MTATATEPTTVPATLYGNLLLARLLPPAKRPPGPAVVRADVGKFFRDPPSDDRWQEAIDELVEANLLTTRPLRLTEAGRTRAFDFLGVSELPPRSNWGTIQAKFLVPKALGLAPDSQDSVKRMGKEENLAAILLKRRFELAVSPSPGLGEALEALVCRELGFPETTTLEEVKRRVLSRLVGAEELLDSQTVKKTLPRVLLNAKRGGVAGLRDVLLASWAEGNASLPETAPSAGPRPEAPVVGEAVPSEFDLQAFAQTVKAAARSCPTGRFGDNKVFINHVWRCLRDEPGFPPMDLPTFKHRLTEANNARLVTLSRADLPEVMDPADVQESQTRYLNGEFHFVLVEKEQP
jgi:hypothetical protein